jgi:hypothetical protein
MISADSIDCAYGYSAFSYFLLDLAEGPFIDILEIVTLDRSFSIPERTVDMPHIFPGAKQSES